MVVVVVGGMVMPLGAANYKSRIAPIVIALAVMAGCGYWMAYPQPTHRKHFGVLEVSHGRPYSFLSRYHLVRHDFFGNGPGPWEIGSRFDFEWRGLAADLVLLALVGVGTYMAVANHLRRRRWFQLSLLELLSGFALVGLAAAVLADRPSGAERLWSLGVRGTIHTIHPHRPRLVRAYLSSVGTEETLSEALAALKNLREVQEVELSAPILSDEMLLASAPVCASGLYFNEQYAGGSRITDFGLAALAGNTRLHALGLPPQCTDRSGVVLESLSELRFLSLSASRVTDAILPSIGRLPRLVHLDAGRTQCTGRGLKYLSNCQRLRTLILWQTQVGDDGLEALTDLPRLEVVNLWGCRTGNAGAAKLAKVRTLRSLTLAETQVSDEGIRALASLEELEELTLDKTRVGDESIDALLALKKLRVLIVVGAKFTPEGLAKLKAFSAQNPRLRVYEFRSNYGVPYSPEHGSLRWNP